MEHATQVRLARTLLDHVESGAPLRNDAVAAVPARNYTDVEHLAAETARVLGPLPQMVALTGDVPNPGSYVVRELPGASVVIARDTDGAVHASVNACRHRGARVVEDRGTGRRLTCPYHSWTYRPDGTLAGIPDAESFAGFDADGCRLPQLPVAEVAGTIWVVPDGTGSLDADRVRRELGPFVDDFEAIATADHAHWRNRRFELDLNWKLVVDTFLEPYHLGSLHRDSVGPYFHSNLCTIDQHGDHVREVLPRRTITELRELAEEEWDLISRSTVVYSLFPATVFVIQMDRIETWRVRPVEGDPGRCIADLDFYIHPERLQERPERYWERNWELTVGTVLDEDFTAMAGVQANLAAGHLDRLTFGRNEPALTIFHHALAARVGEAP